MHKTNWTIFTDKPRLLFWLVLLLVCGFLAISVPAYLSSRQAIRHSITEQGLPLTSDNIYSEIQKDLLRPIFISSLMANDTFVRDWILHGEQNPQQIVRYLNEVKQKYGTITSFLVSEKTRRYYYAGGTLKAVAENEPRDAWYFRVRAMSAPYEINVDPDLANRDTMTIFINYRLLDFKGHYIGATGVGLTLDTVNQLIESYQTRFMRRIYFVNRAGEIVLAGKAMQASRGSIRDLPGISTLASQILQGRTEAQHLEYRHRGNTVLLNSRFIPELNWFLVVEQDEAADVRAIQRVFYINLAISVCVTLLVLMLTVYIVNRYQRRLEHMAMTDVLTGLLNRQAFELINRQSMLDAERHGMALSAILLDLDHFKAVNDHFGHLQGDAILCETARIAQQVLRESDIICRWGGEEFLILLKDCPLEQACLVAEKLRQALASHDFQLADHPITASMGVVQYRRRESSDSFFGRADEALYRAKALGRDRVEH